MYRLFALTLLLLSLGCGGDPPAAQEAPDESTTSPDATVERSAPQNVPPSEYPERADVERLLVRALELESNGNFQDALVVASQAVAIDPSSPRANEIKERLEELLRRIKVVPEIDERSAPSEIAQRTE